MLDEVDRTNTRDPTAAKHDAGTLFVRPTLIFWITYLILLVGLAFSGALYAVNPGMDARENGWQIPFHLLATQDAAWLACAVFAYPVAWRIARHVKIPELDGLSAKTALALAIVVFLITALGTRLIYHDFALSMDEFMMRWHSRLLLYGYLLAPAPENWIDLSTALRPGFLLIDYQYQTWVPGYRPGTAFLHAAFTLFGLGTLMNPLFCGVAVLVLWRLANQIDLPPNGATACTLLLFASSAQFLITGMTPYTMTAHLLATLVWLWLFTQDKPATHVGAIFVGCYALGLHHVHVHSFMALPFLLHLAFAQRRWQLAALYASAYTVCGLGWIFWIDIAIWAQSLSQLGQGTSPVDGDLGFVAMAVNQAVTSERSSDLLNWATNATRLVAWQNLAFLPLVALAIWRIRTAPLALRLLTWSLATSLVPYILLMPSQGHGWGYRYLHQCMGHIALLAGYGWSVARESGMLRLNGFACALFAFSVAVALPLRGVQTESAVRPFAETMDHLKAIDADILLIPTETIWYGRDLVRNDPLLRTAPIILAIEHVPASRLERLCSEYHVLALDNENMRNFGMQLLPDIDGRRAVLDAENRQKLSLSGCRP